MSAPFQVSDKVVCVNDHFTPEQAALFDHLPRKGQVYVVRKVESGSVFDPPVRGSCLQLVGFRSSDGSDDHAFFGRRFRRLTHVQRPPAPARKKTRAAPDWRYHPPTVLRDVRPGCVPVPFYCQGKLWRTWDAPVKVIEGVEAIARKERLSFGFTLCRILSEQVKKAHREKFGF